MTVIERGAALNYRFLDAIRHKRAFEVADSPARASDFAAMEGHHYALVVTFKRSGEAVPSPVLFALAEGKVVFRTDASVGKVKRMRTNPRVLVGPCNIRGKPLGPLAAGHARFLAGAAAEEARLALRRNYTLPMGVFESGVDRMPIEVAYVEITPESEVEVAA
jgi:PPOX class probable F420-dependent enzyme